MNASVEGMDEIRKSFGALGMELTAQAMDGLKKAGLKIIADAQTNLRANKSVVFGRLRQSGKVQPTQDKNTLDVGFFSEGSDGGYAEYVEYGRPSGKLPPPAALAMWAKRKFSLDDKDAKARGWATARSIAANGSTPRPFFKPAVDKNEHEVTKSITTSVKHYIDNRLNRH